MKEFTVIPEYVDISELYECIFDAVTSSKRDSILKYLSMIWYFMRYYIITISSNDKPGLLDFLTFCL